jgi:hypothetical protein
MRRNAAHTHSQPQENCQLRHKTSRVVIENPRNAGNPPLAPLRHKLTPTGCPRSGAHRRYRSGAPHPAPWRGHAVYGAGAEGRAGGQHEPLHPIRGG